MRFSNESHPTRYNNPRDRRKMLLLVVLLGLVWFAFRWAQNPRNWDWFAQMSGVDATGGDVPRLEELDFRVQPDPSESLGPDEFPVELAAADATVDVPEDEAESGVELPAGLLDEMQDNRVGALRKERPAIDYIIEKVRGSRLADLEQASESDVAFTVLMVQTDEHRGRLITLRGTLWRLELFDGGEEDAVDDELYEAWMFTADSGDNPVRLLLTEIPEGLSTGDRLDREVLFTGYFVKRYGYVSEGGQHVAPMLIGKTLRVIRPAAVPEPGHVRRDLGRYVLIFFTVMASIFGLIIWRFTRSDREFSSSRLQEIADSRLDARSEDLAALGDLETVDPSQAFKELGGE